MQIYIQVFCHLFRDMSAKGCKFIFLMFPKNTSSVSKKAQTASKKHSPFLKKKHVMVPKKAKSRNVLPLRDMSAKNVSLFYGHFQKIAVRFQNST